MSQPEVSRSEWFLVSMASVVLQTDASEVLKQVGILGAARTVGAFIVKATDDGKLGLIAPVIEKGLDAEMKQLTAQAEQRVAKKHQEEILNVRSARSSTLWMAGAIGFTLGLAVGTFALIGLTLI